MWYDNLYRDVQTESIIEKNILERKYGLLFTNSDIYNVEKSNFKINEKFLKEIIMITIHILTVQKKLKKLSKGVHIYPDVNLEEIDFETILNATLGKNRWYICKDTLLTHHDLTYQLVSYYQIYTNKNIDVKGKYKDIKQIFDRLIINYEYLNVSDKDLKYIAYGNLLDYCDLDNAEEEIEKLYKKENITHIQLAQSMREYKNTWKR